MFGTGLGGGAVIVKERGASTTGMSQPPKESQMTFSCRLPLYVIPPKGPRTQIIGI